MLHFSTLYNFLKDVFLKPKTFQTDNTSNSNIARVSHFLQGAQT